MTEYHEHDKNEKFTEVKIPYVDSFNKNLKYLGQMQYRAAMLRGFLTFTVLPQYELKVIIHPNDHLPPHFHVCAMGSRPAFTIEACERLKGHKGLERKNRQIKKIWKHGRYEILEQWNKFRPDDGSYQKMEIPDFWPPRNSINTSKFSFSKDQMDDWKK